MRKMCLVGLLAVAQIFAAPANAIWILSNATSSSLNFIQDGTSNTIQFGETSRGEMCFSNVGIPTGITDGSSNTIILSETVGLQFTPHTASSGFQFFGDGSVRTITPGGTSGCVGGVQFGNVIAPSILDGTNNTIVIGETSQFDACFNNVNLFTFGDGSVRTVTPVKDEGVCYRGVGVKGDVSTADPLAAAVPEPGTLALLASGLLALGMWRRKGKPQVIN